MRTLAPRVTVADAGKVKPLGQTTERIRGRQNQVIRERHYRETPLCVRCLAKNPPIIRVWTQLDHIVALVNGGSNDDSNRAGLCADCHAIKTSEDMGIEYKPKVLIGEDGYPIESMG